MWPGNFTRRTLRAIFIILCLSTPALCSQTPDSSQQLIQKARQFIDLNKYKEAKTELAKALKQEKASYDANILMALVYKNLENRKEAIKFSYQAVKLQPENPEGHYLLAALFYETNESGQARKELDTAFRKSANFANAYELKGYFELADQDYKAALEAFEKALQLTPKENVLKARRQETAEFLKSYVEFRSMTDKSSITRPVALNAPRPNYTEEARSKGIQGSVLIIVRVTEEGMVKGWILQKGLGYGLDEQAIIAARQLRFTPAMKEGKPITYWQSIAVEFNLGR